MLPDIDTKPASDEEDGYMDDFEPLPGPSRESSAGGPEAFHNLQFSNVMTVPPIVSPNKQLSYKLERKRIRGLETKLFPMMNVGYPPHELSHFLKVRGVKDPRERAMIVQGATYRYDQTHPERPYDPRRPREDDVEVDTIINAREPRYAKGPTETSVPVHSLRLSNSVLGKLDRATVAKRQMRSMPRPVIDRAPPRQRRSKSRNVTTPLETKLDRAEAARARALAKLQSAQARRDQLAAEMEARELAAKREAAIAMEESHRRRDQAAVQLQSTFRGYRGRGRAYRHKEEMRATYESLGGSPAKRHPFSDREAAVRIQAQYRGMAARERVEEKIIAAQPAGSQFSIRGLDFTLNSRRFKPRRARVLNDDQIPAGQVEREMQLNRYMDAPEDIEGQLFKVIDTDKDGLISPDDLREFLGTTDADISQLDFDLMLAEADLDGDGMLTISEFTQYMRSMQRKEKEENKRRRANMDAKTRRTLLIARLNGMLSNPIENDPRFIKQKIIKKKSLDEEEAPTCAVAPNPKF